MELILALVKSGTFRRLIVYVVGLLVVLLNRKLGLDLNTEELAGAVVLAITYLIQSASKEKVLAKAEADGQRAVEAAGAARALFDGAAKASEVAK
jgi:hypothetical protein